MCTAFQVSLMGTLAKYSIALIAYAAGGLTNAWLVTHGAPQNMVLRWLVAFGMGYLVFVLLVRLYCYAHAPARRFRDRGGGLDGGFDGGDVLDAALRVARSCPRSTGQALPSGGGQFGGAGASGSFDAPLSSPPAPLSSPLSDLSFDIPLVDEGVGILATIAVVIALIALALGLGASLLYVLWQMPELLADAVAGAAAVGLASRRAEGWWGAITRHTWKPVLVGLLSLVVTGTLLHLAVPQAHTLGEALAAVGRGEVHLTSTRDDGTHRRGQPLSRDRGRGAG
jgi:hypothetical protein